MRFDPSLAEGDRRELAVALRELRKAAGLSGERVAVRCGMSQSKVSRIENGRLLPSMIDVEQMLDALGADPPTRDDLLALARMAHAEYQDDRASVRRGIHHRQRELATMEANSTRMRHFLPTLITGLLQTANYMHVAMNPPMNPAVRDPTRAIELKLARQAVLSDESKRFEFLLTESALRWRLCAPEVLAAQLDHLVAVSHCPNVSIGVLPLAASIPMGAFHTFVVYDRKLVTAELFSGQLVLRDPKDVDYYQALFDYFSERAHWGEDSRAALSELADEFRGQ
jgi:transcriptional regulator with XRE-family HTH domain